MRIVMKKVMTLVLAAVLLIVLPCEAFAEMPDLSAMSTEELHALVDAARNELTSRELTAGGETLIVDQDGVQVYLTGEYKVEDWGDGTVDLYLEAVIVNNTDHGLAVVEDGISVNGWNVTFFGIGEISAGKKKKANFELWISDASISTYEEIEEIEFGLRLLNEDTYEGTRVSDPVTVHFS